MKKTLLLGFFMMSFSALAQVAQWDYTNDQLTFNNNTFYTKEGIPVNGVIKNDMYDYYSIIQLTNGKPTGIINFYENNGTFVGSATIPSEGNTLIPTDPDSEAYKKMQESYTQDEFKKSQMRLYVYTCYSNFKDMLSPDGGKPVQNMNCQDIVPEYLKSGIGKPEAFKARRINNTIVVETPFIAQKYRSSILTQNGEDGMYAEIQRTGKAIFTFKDKE